jgi:hypothetical protein
MQQTTVHWQDFNELFCQAFDESVSGILGSTVLISLYAALQKHYSITRDEVPYRMETVYFILDSVFAVKGSRIIEKQIIRRFYNKLGLPFNDADGYALKDYVDAAAKKLQILA